MAPEVTKSRKASRAFRIAHTALVRYGYMEATGDISLDEFSENEGADMSEVPPSPTNNIDVSPVPTLRTPAAPAQTVASMTSRSSMLSGVGSVLSSARRRIPSLRVPRVGQTVSKGLPEYGSLVGGLNVDSCEAIAKESIAQQAKQRGEGERERICSRHLSAIWALLRGHRWIGSCAKPGQA